MTARPTMIVEFDRTDINTKDKAARVMRVSLAAPKDPALQAKLFNVVQPTLPEPVATIQRRNAYEAEAAQAMIRDWLVKHGREISTTDLLENDDFKAAYGKNFTKSGITYHLRALRDAGRISCDLRMFSRGEGLPQSRTCFWCAKPTEAT